MQIEASIEQTWARAIDYPSWQQFSMGSRRSGAAGKEGEVMLLKKEEGGVEMPPYYARTVKLERMRRIVWKTFPEQRTPAFDFFGFVDFQFQPHPSGTLFRNNLLYEFNVPDEAAIAAFQQQQATAADVMWRDVFVGRLKPMLENQLSSRG